MVSHLYNLSCYEEFEIWSTLAGISKVDILKEICHQIDDYYFFVSEDGIFNWFDLDGNHIEDPEVLKMLKCEHIPVSISKCIIPNSVICIGNNAFAECDSLTSITIPNSVISIDNRAFYNCTSLTSITIPTSVTSIGKFAFSSCESLKEITMPDNVTHIGINAFYKCISLKEVIFKGKTLNKVKRMKCYPFGIKDENVFKFS